MPPPRHPTYTVSPSSARHCAPEPCRRVHAPTLTNASPVVASRSILTGSRVIAACAPEKSSAPFVHRDVDLSALRCTGRVGCLILRPGPGRLGRSGCCREPSRVGTKRFGESRVVRGGTSPRTRAGSAASACTRASPIRETATSVTWGAIGWISSGPTTTTGRGGRSSARRAARARGRAPPGHENGSAEGCGWWARSRRRRARRGVPPLLEARPDSAQIALLPLAA